MFHIIILADNHAVNNDLGYNDIYEIQILGQIIWNYIFFLICYRSIQVQKQFSHQQVLVILRSYIK